MLQVFVAHIPEQGCVLPHKRLTGTHGQELGIVRGQAGVERDKSSLCFCCKERTSKNRISGERLHRTVSGCSRMSSFLASGSGYDPAEEWTELCQTGE